MRSNEGSHTNRRAIDGRRVKSRRRAGRRLVEQRKYNYNHHCEQTKPERNTYDPLSPAMAIITLDDSSDEMDCYQVEENVSVDIGVPIWPRGPRKRKGNRVDTKPEIIDLVEGCSRNEPIVAEQTQLIKSVVKKSKRAIISDITAVVSNRTTSSKLQTRSLFNIALGDIIKSKEADGSASEISYAKLPQITALRRSRQHQSTQDMPGRRLPREIVKLIITFMQPDKTECLALRGVSYIFYDAITMWQTDDAKRLFALRYGPEMPPAHLPWAMDTTVLARYAARRTATATNTGQPEIASEDVIRPSSFHRWVALTSPRFKPPICLRCGRSDNTLVIRDGADLGRFCTRCWDSADLWLRWRLCHWVRALDDLAEFRLGWFVALSDFEWLDIVPCHYDVADNKKWTDCPPHTLELRPDGQWEPTIMNPAEWHRLSTAEDNETKPLPPGFLSPMSETSEGSSAHLPIIL
ncbi:hypothetical protein BDF19DRAFT_422140 [Syncephalis fuscata]|nr:hypothetical protein BDF19DRAFT_422140 [Syncephalis fuscata]